MQKPVDTKHHRGLSEFFRDSRGQFSVFTVIALIGAAALIWIAVLEARAKSQVQVELLYALFIMYCVNVLSDSLLAAVIERGVWKTPPVPDTVVNADVQADSINVNAEGETKAGPADDEPRQEPG